MLTSDDALLICVFLGNLIIFAAIGMTFYLGKTSMKKIDKFVYGFEMPSDSIFSQLIRIPGYAGAFAWKWGAKRSKLEKLRDEFDTKFQRPYKITFWLYISGSIFYIVSYLLYKFMLS